MPVLLPSSLGTLLAPSKAESSRGAVWQTILQARNGVAGSLSPADDEGCETRQIAPSSGDALVRSFARSVRSQIVSTRFHLAATTFEYKRGRE